MRSLCGLPRLHVVEDFEEGEGHAAADDHLIHLIQHVVDQLDLIFHLRSETQREAGHISIDKNHIDSIEILTKARVRVSQSILH